MNSAPEESQNGPQTNIPNPSQQQVPNAEKPAEEPAANEKKGRDGEVILNRVRTYQDAIKEALRSQNVSSASLLMAEQRRREQTEEIEENNSIKTPRNKWFAVGAVTLVVAGLLVLGFAFLSSDERGTDNNPRGVVTQPFFETDGTVEVASAQLSRNTLLKIQQVLSGPMPGRTVQHVVITKEERADPNSQYVTTRAVPYDSTDLIALLAARTPDSFLRSVEDEFMLGVHVLGNNRTFLVFRITNFDNVFAAMFQWEGSLVRDMAQLFYDELSPLLREPEPVTPTTPQTTGTTTADTSTSTVDAQIPQPSPQRTTASLRFQDEIINNSDARVIKNQNGETVFFYTFIDEEYLYFGTSPQTFNEIRKRIRSARLII